MLHNDDFSRDALLSHWAPCRSQDRVEACLAQATAVVGYGHLHRLANAPSVIPGAHEHEQIVPHVEYTTRSLALRSHSPVCCALP